MKIIILVGGDADDYEGYRAKLSVVAERAQAVAAKAVKLAADLKTISTPEGKLPNA